MRITKVRYAGEQVYRVWQDGICFGEFIDKEYAELFREKNKHKSVEWLKSENNIVPTKNWRKK